MQRFLVYILAGLSVAAAQTTQAPMKVTLEQIAQDAQFDASLPKYKGKTLQLTGVVYGMTRGSKSVVSRFPDSPSTVWVKPTAAAPDYARAQNVTCVLPGLELDKVDLLKRDLPVRVTGVFVGYSLTFGGRMDPCNVEILSEQTATKPAPAASNAPPDPPFGDYAVYQLVYPAFAYQYRIKLFDRDSYGVNGGAASGRYSYDARTKTLNFQTGDLKGFIGVYYTQGRNADGPTICLSHNGQAPDIEHTTGKGYQWAYYRPAGMGKK